MNGENIKRKVLRLSIIGDSQTGKTSILNRWNGIDFTFELLSNIGIDKQEKIMKMKDGKEMKIVVWDTAGQERFHSISSGTIKNSNGIIVCFSINKRESFNNVVGWLQDVREISPSIPIVLFGNKCDLIKERKITKEEAQAFAKNNKIIYFETSAKENINIMEGFEKIVDEAYSKTTKKDETIKLESKKVEQKKKLC